MDDDIHSWLPDAETNPNAMILEFQLCLVRLGRTVHRDNRGLIKARIEMQVPKAEDPEIYVDIVFQVSERDGALSARPLSIRKSNEEN